MIRNLGIVFLVLISFNLSAQESLLRYDKSNHKVYQGKTKMSMDDLFSTMRTHPQSFELIESARDSKFYASIFYTLGSVPLGYSLGYLLFTNEVRWPFVAVGAGLIGIAIPFHISYLKRTQRAVNAFNSRSDSGMYQLQFSVGFNQNGIGLCLEL
jgi:hypothetical protein